MINYHDDSVELKVVLAGYWSDIVFKVLECIHYDIENYDLCIFDDYEDDENVEEIEEQIRKMQEECNCLLARSDIDSKAFCNAFKRICEFYNVLYDQEIELSEILDFK